MNIIRTAMLMAAMTALFVGIGYLLAGEAGLLIALAIAGGINLFAYWNSDKMVLRMHNAREVDAHSAPQFYGLVQTLSNRANLPMPKLYIIDEAAAECLCHRAQSGKRRGRGNDWFVASPDNGRAGRRDGPRIGPYSPSRYPFDDDNRDHRRRYFDAGEFRLFLWPGPQQSARDRRYPVGDDPGTYRRGIGANGDQPDPGVCC